MVEATLSPSAHMASLGGPLERERRAEGVPNPPAHPHITEPASSAFCKDWGCRNPPKPTAQDEAQPFSKGSSGRNPTRSHPVFLCGHCISLNITGKTQQTVEFLGMPQETSLRTVTP